MDSHDSSNVTEPFNYEQLRNGLCILFLKFYSHDNYIPSLDAPDNYATEFSQYLSDLNQRMKKFVNNADSESKYDEFIHWLYVGLLRRRFPRGFKYGFICHLITRGCIWNWRDEEVTRVFEAINIDSPSNPTDRSQGWVILPKAAYKKWARLLRWASRASKHWNHEVLQSSSRPKR